MSLKTVLCEDSVVVARPITASVATGMSQGGPPLSIVRTYIG